MLSCGHILADMSLKRWEDTLWQKRINEVGGYEDNISQERQQKPTFEFLKR